MRIASWNVNSVKARLPIITDWLASDRCDVLLMQETKSQDENFPHQIFADAGWHTAFHGQKKL
jgi:exodeoxyribonuclease-3